MADKPKNPSEAFWTKERVENAKLVYLTLCYRHTKLSTNAFDTRLVGLFFDLRQKIDKDSEAWLKIVKQKAKSEAAK